MNCSSSPEITEDPIKEHSNTKPNMLLIIADDVSKDAVPTYTEGIIKANMPNLQGLIITGITFDNVWAYPVCSPTRASIITGKYGFKTGVLKVEDPISLSEISEAKSALIVEAERIRS
ncbi:MAG: sulfatase-like hydrolase/transferase [Polaribacter sp.]|nr:sulfatase-like hydrolase/transferase [Polaribacter sp.]